MSSETNYQGQLQRLWTFSDICPSTRKKILWAECFYISVDTKTQLTKVLAEQDSIKRFCRCTDRSAMPTALDSLALPRHRGTAQLIFLEQGRYYSLPNVQTPDLCHLSHISSTWITQKQGENWHVNQSFGLTDGSKNSLVFPV